MPAFAIISHSPTSPIATVQTELEQSNSLADWRRATGDFKQPERPNSQTAAVQRLLPVAASGRFTADCN